MTSSPSPAIDHTDPKPREAHEAFRITEPSGKTYRIFADGRTEGFQRGALICNYIPALLASAESKFHVPSSPNKSDVLARGGASHSVALSVPSAAEKISTAAGVK